MNIIKTIIFIILLFSVGVILENYDIFLSTLYGIDVFINISGAVIPILIATIMFLLSKERITNIIGIVAISIIFYRYSIIMPNMGIVTDMLLPVLYTIMLPWFLSSNEKPQLAYICGTMGALIGADLLNLTKITELQAIAISIGGAGIHDGVFLNGIVALTLVVLFDTLFKIISNRRKEAI